MEKEEHRWTNDGYTLRCSRPEDAEEYYQQNFNPLDAEIARLTGCKTEFTREEVVNFFLECTQSDSRYHFLMIAPDGRIVGESIINDIDTEARSANYRIGIFQPTERGKGIGSWAVRTARDFAFETLQLHRLELDVFSFNQHAQKIYTAAGFQVEGVLRDAIWDGRNYADDILMSILEDDWRAIR